MNAINLLKRQHKAKMTVLSELVLHHVDEEEKEMFKAANKLGKAELEELGTRMQARFEAMIGRQRREAA